MSAYDITDCPSDPVEPARERLRDLMVRDNPGNPYEKVKPRSYDNVLAFVAFIGFIVVVLAAWIVTGASA
jgi:hypothetical protein